MAVSYISKMVSELKSCAECGEEIKGRADKRFCDDACRNSYNYSQNKAASNYVRNVTNILKRNRKILADLNPSGKTKTHRDKLSEKGFNFTYHTNTLTTRKGAIYIFFYEQGYVELDNGWLLLVRRDEYLGKTE